MMVIISLMLSFFGNVFLGEMSYPTRATSKTSEGFINEIVHPPNTNTFVDVG